MRLKCLVRIKLRCARSDSVLCSHRFVSVGLTQEEHDAVAAWWTPYWNRCNLAWYLHGRMQHRHESCHRALLTYACKTKLWRRHYRMRVQWHVIHWNSNRNRAVLRVRVRRRGHFKDREHLRADREKPSYAWRVDVWNAMFVK